MRPETLDEFVGQDHIVGEGKLLRKAIDGDRLFSMLFWGPPGTGKTTLARIAAQKGRAVFVPFSAVTVGVKEIREVTAAAGDAARKTGVRTLLFLDEIHRFNKAQQDYLLPHVEDGTVILIGATTENPSFEVNGALLSRLRVFVFEPLSTDVIADLVQRALKTPSKGLGALALDIRREEALLIGNAADGDARRALNILEIAAEEALRRSSPLIERAVILEAAQSKRILYDKAGEEHFNLISALHKSLRDGDADAGLYWMGRMIEGGEDPLYIARRLIRFASEDVGLASPGALEQAVAAYQACLFVGLPECALALAQVVVFLAAAPKSNSLYTAYNAVKKEIQRSGRLPTPLVLRNAPTEFMKGLGYGKGYKYAHDFPDARVEQRHLPEALEGKTFYRPTERGFEETIRRRLGYESEE
jgi:putative ATPase